MKLDKFSVELPLPPSTNHLYFNRPGGRTKTPAYRAWAQAAGWILAALPRPAWAGEGLPLGLVIEAGIDRRRDLGNIEKAVSDLVLGYLGTDDKWLDVIVLKRRPALKGRVRVQVRPLKTA